MTFEIGDRVQTNSGLYIGSVWREAGFKGKVVRPENAMGLVTVKFKGVDDVRFMRPEYLILRKKAEVEEETSPAPDFDGKSLEFAEDSPEVQEALALILERIEEIKTLLTTKPQHEVYITVNEASFVTPEVEEEPAPEPVFKKAKEVQAGDSMYTEAGVWDKVDRIETKDSGYTSLYGVFGNKIAQVPSGRVVQVLEEVS